MKTVSNCLWCDSKNLQLFAHRKDGVAILKCNDCLLLMVNKIPDNLEEYYYNEGYYNNANSLNTGGYTEVYDLMSPAFLFWQNSFIEEIDESNKTKTFLEIGAATGNLLEILKYNQKNLILKGIDISEYAVKVAQEKGFDAKVKYIEDYTSNPKMDIIFSSETMEHLENLRSFLKGVNRNLANNGTFLFYVPSISESDAEKERDSYLRFNINLEHLLHFSPEFLKNELSTFFKTPVLIKEFKTAFGPCILGAVSKDANNLRNLKKLFTALEGNRVPKQASDIFLKNLVIFALKFGQFELADKALMVLKRSKTFDKDELILLKGLSGYHKGELIKSNLCFEKYLRARPGNQFIIRLLLSNERELNKIYENEINRHIDEINRHIDEVANLNQKVISIENEMINLRKSKIVGSAIKLRAVTNQVLGSIRSFKFKR